MSKSKGTPTKKTFLLFRRYMSGITIACVIVMIVGSVLADVSFLWTTVRALGVWFGMSVIVWVLVKACSAWEVTQGGENTR